MNGTVSTDISTWRAQLTDQVLRIAAIVGAPAVIYAVVTEFNLQHISWKLVVELLVFGVVMALIFWKRSPYLAKGSMFLLVLFSMATMNYQSAGLISDGSMWLVVFVMAAMILFGLPGGIAATALAVVDMLIFGGFFANGVIAMPRDAYVGWNTNFQSWVGSALIMGVLCALLIFSQNRILARLVQSLFQSQQTRSENARWAEQERAERQRLEQMVAEYVRFLKRAAQGDLSTRLDIRSNAQADQDPLLELGEQLNATVASLQKMIGQINQAATNLHEASEEIMSVTTQQVSGATEQSAAISQTASTVAEIQAVAQHFIGLSETLASSAEQAQEMTHSGKNMVQGTLNSMEQIRKQVQGIVDNITILARRAQQINEITGTVNDIAAQSNMLALNAAVEAARAGDQGKGFAVVAREVRSLAEQSQQATAQVKTILQDIQKAVQATLHVTEEGALVVEQGVSQAEQSGQVIEQMAGMIDTAFKSSNQMISNVQQQTTGIEQITLAMHNIRQATLQHLEKSRDTEEAIRNLRELAAELNQTVAGYQA